MKKLLLVLPLVCFSMQAHYFEFVDSKTNNALDKKFIKKLVDTFKCDTFFETGTYCCATTLNAAPYFKKIYTVELFDQLYQQAKRKLSPYKNIKPFFGKSPEIIEKMGPELCEKNVLFWLDAHYSGPGTALSNADENDPDAVTAIRGELKSIKEAGIKNCTILIDDIRGFGTEINGKEYLGCWAYPSLQEVVACLLEINPHFEVALLGDTLVAYDNTKYNPEFSPTVKACTATRLYNGHNLTDEELISYEEKIMQAPAHEKACIKNLYHQMTQYKDPMFWHDLWYGLVELGDGNYVLAREALSKTKVRTQYFTKNRQSDNSILLNDHPRIDAYLQLCQR